MSEDNKIRTKKSSKFEITDEDRKNMGKNKNSALNTVGKDSASNTELEHTYKARKSKHTLLKTAVVGYVLKKTHQKHQYNKLTKKLNRLEQQRRIVEIAAHGSNGQPSAFESYVNYFETERIKNRLEKYSKKIGKGGRGIQNMLMGINSAASALAMKHAVGSPRGNESGISRYDIPGVGINDTNQLNNDEGQIEYY